MMTVKKKFALVVTLVFMLLAMAGQGWASTPLEKPVITREKAMEIAQKAFNLPVGFQLTNISYRDSWGPYGPAQGKVWVFAWSKNDLRRHAEISIAVDAQTGVVREINNWSWDEGTPTKQKTKYSREQARVKAETLIKKLQPGELEQCRLAPQNPWEIQQEVLMDENYPMAYNFNYVRQVNGIPYPMNSFNVTVDGATGEIRNYRFDWEETSFPSADKIVNAEEAFKAFREKLGLELAYQRDYAEYGPGQIRLVYRIREGWGLNIDAERGELIDSSGNPVSLPNPEPLVSGGQTGPAGNPRERELNVDEALAIAQQRIGIPEGYKLVNSEYRDTLEPFAQKVWSFYWSKNDSYRPGNLSVEVDALTGEIRSFYRYFDRTVPQKEGVKVLSYEEAKAKAIAALKEFQPGKMAELRLEPNFDAARIMKAETVGEAMPYNFRFTRLVNGLPYSNNGVWIDIDSITGEVISFGTNWEQAEFPPVDKVISLAEAYRIFREKAGLELVYNRAMIPAYYGEPKLGDLKLIYRIRDLGYNAIDAKTGEVMDPVYFLKLRSFKDVKGHWAQREIENLSVKGIVSGDNGNFKPDDPITRAEFAKLIVTVKRLKPVNPETPTFSDVPKEAWYYGFVEAAAQAGLMKGEGKNFKPEAPITREEIVAIMIRALEKEEEAKAKAKEKSSYRDADKIAPWAKGAVILGTQLELVKGQEGYFLPKKTATRGEGAVFITRLISKLNTMENVRQIGYSR